MLEVFDASCKKIPQIILKLKIHVSLVKKKVFFFELQKFQSVHVYSTKVSVLATE